MDVVSGLGRSTESTENLVKVLNGGRDTGRTLETQVVLWEFGVGGLGGLGTSPWRQGWRRSLGRDRSRAEAEKDWWSDHEEHWVESNGGKLQLVKGRGT